MIYSVTCARNMTRKTITYSKIITYIASITLVSGISETGRFACKSFRLQADSPTQVKSIPLHK